MGKIFVLLFDGMTDYEITFLLHLLGADAGKEIVTIAQEEGAILGRSGLRIEPSRLILDVREEEAEGIILCGGWCEEIKPELLELLQEMDHKGKLISGICGAGTVILAKAGILNNVTYTTPVTEWTKDYREIYGDNDPFPRENYLEKRVVRDNNVITAIGPAFVDFAIEICDWFELFENQEERESFTTNIQGEGEIQKFLNLLASKSATPGGGGASALIAAISTALCSMVANLTLGKKKYEMYQAEIEEILVKVENSRKSLLYLMKKDEEVFAPLAKAYVIPKENEKREEILEAALLNACSVPMELLIEVEKIVESIEELVKKGSRLAISDVGVAASSCRSAIESAVLNVMINTKLMKDRAMAEKLNKQAYEVSNTAIIRCSIVYEKVLSSCMGNE